MEKIKLEAGIKCKTIGGGKSEHLDHLYQSDGYLNSIYGAAVDDEFRLVTLLADQLWERPYVVRDEKEAGQAIRTGRYDVIMSESRFDDLKKWEGDIVLALDDNSEEWTLWISSNYRDAFILRGPTALFAVGIERLASAHEPRGEIEIPFVKSTIDDIFNLLDKKIKNEEPHVSEVPRLTLPDVTNSPANVDLSTTDDLVNDHGKTNPT